MPPCKKVNPLLWSCKESRNHSSSWLIKTAMSLMIFNLFEFAWCIEERKVGFNSSDWSHRQNSNVNKNPPCHMRRSVAATFPSAFRWELFLPKLLWLCHANDVNNDLSLRNKLKNLAELVGIFHFLFEPTSLPSFLPFFFLLVPFSSTFKFGQPFFKVLSSNPRLSLTNLIIKNITMSLVAYLIG